MDWRLRRRRDRLAQELYFEEHRFCEVCGRQGYHVHEILFRSKGGKCVKGNMITLCLEDHDRSHRRKKPYLSQQELFDIKKGGRVDRVVRVQG